MILRQFGIDIILYTCGANGTHVFTPSEISSVNPEDMLKDAYANTTGGGDSFTGGWCAAYLERKSIREAHLIATEVSAYVCTKNGAMPDKYTKDFEYDRFHYCYPGIYNTSDNRC